LLQREQESCAELRQMLDHDRAVTETLKETISDLRASLDLERSKMGNVDMRPQMDSSVEAELRSQITSLMVGANIRHCDSV